MNLARMVKMRQLDDKLDNLSDMEFHFLSLLSELKSSSNDYETYYYNKREVCVLVHRFKYNKFVFGADEFWSVFSKKYNLNIGDVRRFFKKTLENRLGFEGVWVSGHEIFLNHEL